MGLKYEKWEGTGNDFVLVDGRQAGVLPSDWDPAEIERICDREQGVGADGVLVVKLGAPNVLHVDFRNPDGSRSFCGNGTRSALAWAQAQGAVDARGHEVQIEAVDGGHKGRIRPDGCPGISMNVASTPVACAPQLEGAHRASFVDTGSPHHVEWLDAAKDVKDLALPQAVRPIRHHERYAPEGCNVNVAAHGTTKGHLHMRTFERGVEAETLSCGTGVVAAALSDMREEEGPVMERTVHAPGGVLEVHVRKNADGALKDVWLWGAAAKVMEGVWSWALMVSLACCGMAAAASSAVASPFSESLSPEAQFSVLTASPGAELYAAFGHTAFRLKDLDTGVDLVFNYGTFVVNKGFYVRFVKGRMDYKLGVERYPRFQNVYLRQGRALQEQVLHLGEEDVRLLAAHLEQNALPEHATYAYDFFRDNCATKVIAVLEDVFGDRFVTNCSPTDITYLEALRPFMGGLPWTGWGMELILGHEAAQSMPSCGHAFLPDVLASELDGMTLDGEPLCFPRELIYPAEGAWRAGLPEGHSGRYAPSRWTWALALWMALLFATRQRGAPFWRHARRWSLMAWGALTTTMTLLFVAMQGVTDHRDTWWNADLFWTSLGCVVLWRALGRRPGPTIPAWFRHLAQVWSVLALLSTWVLPAIHGSQPWSLSLVWPSAGMSVAAVLALWTSFGSNR